MLNHGPQCNWHWDQYDWECDCGAVADPASLKPKWIAEHVARTKALIAQKPREVSPERKAEARALLTPKDPGHG